MTIRILLKRVIQAIAFALAFPFAALTGFGRIGAAFTFFAQTFALFPGAPGDYLRAAFYSLTLKRCSMDIVVSFGSYFVSRDSEISGHVSIGAFCVIGRARIGERTQIASHVEIPSGRRQHQRNADGTLSDLDAGIVVIGSQCWIGAAAVVLAGVGDGSTVGAGSVVVNEIPAGVVAVGNPARAIRTTAGAVITKAV